MREMTRGLKISKALSDELLKIFEIITAISRLNTIYLKNRFSYTILILTLQFSNPHHIFSNVLTLTPHRSNFGQSNMSPTARSMFGVEMENRTKKAIVASSLAELKTKACQLYKLQTNPNDLKVMKTFSHDLSINSIFLRKHYL